MIPLATRRLAERRLLVAKIAATPSAARFRTGTLDVLFSEPQKAREMRLAGYGASYSAEARVALDLGAKPPEASKEIIDITDYSGATLSYTITTVTPLLGQDCYTLALTARSTRPPRSAVPGL